MITVQVILSSYNGERYIREQLDSILAQKEVEVQLLIRDDGSTDGTRTILTEYETRFNNITVMYGENVGVISSFFLLLEQVGNYPYIALADQDDVWLDQKLKRAIDLMEQKDEEKPIVYCSAQQLVDANLKLLPSSMTYPEVKTKFGNALVENMCTGCTCVINQAMLQQLKGKVPNFTIMHDFWIYLVGTCFGTVIYDKESYILYRQHGANELGAASNRWDNYKRRIKNFKKYQGQLTKQAKELLRLYEIELPKEEKKLLQEFIETKSKVRVRVKLLKEKVIFRQRKSDNWMIKILLCMGLL